MTDNIRTAARRAAYVVPVAVALAAAWWFTRDAEPVNAMAGHDHSAMVAAGGGGPVTISAADAKRIGVTFATAMHASLRREVQLAGEVTVDETRVQAVTLKVDGVVERLNADYVGKVIRRGDPLLALYSPMLVSAQEELLIAKRLQANLARGTSPAAGSAGDLTASARRRLLNWDVDPAELEMVEQHGMAHRTMNLRSPVTGTVIEKNVVAGQQVMAGQLLLRVADLSQVWVDGDVFEQDLPLVRVGQTVRVEFRALPGAPRTGRIVSFEPTLDPVTRTARMRVALSNADGKLRPGMFATLQLAAPQPAPTLVVPRGAALTTGERSLVFVRVADGRLEPRPVTVGLSDDTQVEVLTGLTHGDVVVASATFFIDAESNLGGAMAGMAGMSTLPAGDKGAPKAAMPEMDHSQHEMPAASKTVPPAATKAPTPEVDHSAHEMPAAKSPPVRKPSPER
ncbi:MAG: efflux RND transporter periplasmic adaptor subunit [Gemmatimonadetes bacterium]|nr:efflux RND transporter periplasmic adaptor subunit [Gemmatimonadota bacterium]